MNIDEARQIVEADAPTTSGGCLTVARAYYTMYDEASDRGETECALAYLSLWRTWIRLQEAILTIELYREKVKHG